ncbi:MAG TPA: hypothetical protein VHT24_15795 [Pseudacidobacterium sp.]|nr:hypothetical protein [Pseudacidobacterium sp.]
MARNDEKSIRQGWLSNTEFLLMQNAKLVEQLFAEMKERSDAVADFGRLPVTQNGHIFLGCFRACVMVMKNHREALVTYIVSRHI